MPDDDPIPTVAGLTPKQLEELTLDQITDLLRQRAVENYVLRAVVAQTGRFPADTRVGDVIGGDVEFEKIMARAEAHGLNLYPVPKALAG